jgi:hypothetical protein
VKKIISKFFLLSLLVLSQNSFSANFTQIPFYQDLNSKDATILLLNIDGFELNKTIIAYNLKDGIFVPINSLANSLEFPTKMSADGLSASGWFIDEKNKFTIDLNKKIISSNNAKFSLNENNVKKFDGDIFVKLEIIEKIFDFKAQVSELEQLLFINSKSYELPMSQKISRQKKWREFEQNKKDVSGNSKAKPLEIKAPYRLASFPTIDFRYDQQYVSPKNSSTSLGPTLSRVGLVANADILSLNAKIALNALNGEVTNTFISAGRTSQDADLLGPLKATEFTFGDVYSQRTPLVSFARSGVGATVTNYPTQYVSGDIDSVPIRGVIQPGWDVEIYRNNYLIDTQKTSDSGIYEFPVVPLVSGTNNIRVVFYGPNGQKREEKRTYVINSEILQSGKLYYRLTSNKNNQNLINTSQNRLATSAQDKSIGINRNFAEFAYGVTKNFSVAANYNELPVGEKGEIKKYLGASARTSIGGLYLRLDNVSDVDLGSNASQISAQTNLGQYNLLAKMDKYDANFISEERQGSFNPEQRLTLKINGPINIPFSKKTIRFSAGRVEETFTDKKKRSIDELDFSLSLFSRLNFSQNFKNNEDERFGNSAFSKIATGQTILNYRISNDINLRGNLSYNIKPMKEFTFYNIDANYRASKTLNISLNTTHQFASVSSAYRDFTNYGMSITRNISDFTAGIGAKKDDRGGYMVNFNFAMSVGYDPVSNNLKTSSSPMSATGAIIARVFLDENSNGIYEKNEELLENIEFDGGSSGKRNISGKDGKVFITNIATDGNAIIKINEESLSNFYWAPLNTSLKIKTHAGAVTDIDFPIIIIGDIEGYTKYLKNGKISQAAGVEIELIDAKGNVVASTESANNGLFYFDKIPLGRYKIIVKKQWSKDIDYGDTAYTEVTLNKKNKNLTNIGLKIEKNKKETTEKNKNKKTKQDKAIKKSNGEKKEKKSKKTLNKKKATKKIKSKKR